MGSIHAIYPNVHYTHPCPTKMWVGIDTGNPFISSARGSFTGLQHNEMPYSWNCISKVVFAWKDTFLYVLTGTVWAQGV